MRCKILKSFPYTADNGDTGDALAGEEIAVAKLGQPPIQIEALAKEGYIELPEAPLVNGSGDERKNSGASPENKNAGAAPENKINDGATDPDGAGQEGPVEIPDDWIKLGDEELLALAVQVTEDTVETRDDCIAAIEAYLEAAEAE